MEEEQSDSELAQKVRAACEDLNTVLRLVERRGIEVTLTVIDHTTFDSSCRSFMVEPEIKKKL